jgi:hypothetical protein
MIKIYDAVERRVVATGAAIIALPGDDNRGVTQCTMEPGQQLQLRYSYNLVDTATEHSLSAECTARPGGGMRIASFHLT